MDRFSPPRHRPRQRFFRFRSPASGRGLRRISLLRSGLLAGAAVFLALFLAGVLRTGETVRTNETYAAWKQEAEAVLPSSVPPAEPKVERMTMPDGSAITRSGKLQSGLLVPDAVTDTVFHKTSGALLPAMEELRKRNRDLIAWLKIDGVLDLPIVYRDNEFYLNHNFEGAKTPSGTLFLDESHPLTEKAQTLLVHGHNMKDGTMFAAVSHYQDSSWWRAHPVIELTTLWEKEYYVVFAAVLTPTDPTDPDYVNFFTHGTFATDEEFEDYIRLLESRACFPSFITVRPDDALLELSTCIGEDRLVAAARRLRPNESPASLRRLLAQ